MAGPELLFCQMAQREFDALLAVLNSGLFAPILALRILKATIKRIEAVVLAFVEGRLIILEELVLSLFKLAKIDPNEPLGGRDFCRVAFACKAIFLSLFPENGDDPVFVQGIPLSIRNAIRNGDFDLWETYVCKLTLKGILDGFIDDYLSEIQDELDDLLEQLGINKIDEAIQKYFNAITPFLKQMEGLDKYLDCGFATCNFVESSINAQVDFSNKLLISRQGTGWGVKADELIQSVLDKESDLRARINNLRNRLANPKFDSEGVGIDDILKF